MYYFIDRPDVTNYSLKDSVNKLAVPIPSFWTTVLAIVALCGAVRCGAVRCGAVRCGAVLWNSSESLNIK